MRFGRKTDPEPEPPLVYYPGQVVVTGGPRRGLYHDGSRWRDHEAEIAEAQRVATLEERFAAEQAAKHAGNTDGFTRTPTDLGWPSNIPRPQ